MFKIIEKKDLNKEGSCITIEAKLIAQKALPGQFVSISVKNNSGYIPLKLADWNKKEGHISVVCSNVDFFYNKLAKLKSGDNIEQIRGPLGKPTKITKVGEVYCIADGLALAEIYPAIKAFKEAGNRLVSIIEAQNKDLLILEDKIREVSDELFVAINNSKITKNSACDILRDLFDVIDKSTHTHFPDLIYCCGSINLMKEISELTKSYQVNAIVGLNPIVVDTGELCGGCRCEKKGNAVFDYSDGPDFNAEKINFDELNTHLGFIKNNKEKS